MDDGFLLLDFERLGNYHMDPVDVTFKLPVERRHLLRFGKHLIFASTARVVLA